MDHENGMPVGAASTEPAKPAMAHWPLTRWYISSATFSVPQAAGPVAFSLLALGLTGDASGGAAMILATTLAQVVGALPLARLGRNHSSATMLRALIAVRAVALAAIVLSAAGGAAFYWLILLAAVAGSVNGAAFGHLRSVLNQLTPAAKLPRALGIAATLNEVTFVLAPVAASVLGTLSPVLAVVAMTVLGALPALAIPKGHAPRAGASAHGEGSIVTPPILLWYLCAGAGAAAVASIEIGAVALALNFGYEPALAILFTVPLCLASVTGGLWISLRNRRSSREAVLVQFAIMTSGSALVALDHSVAATVTGAILIGLVLAPLATHYSLVLDTLAPQQRRAEVFALLRTANAIGVIVASGLLTVLPLPSALATITGLTVVVTLTVAIASFRSRTGG
ncbi:MFS transporter [Pseudomonas sp. R2.Fl]|nr:MFS transporter [Pseudomonas sp. R2.Fl]